MAGKQKVHFPQKMETREPTVWLPTGAFLESNCPMIRDPEKTKKAVREWLNKIIREANKKLAREQKISNLESTGGNERKKYFDGGKKERVAL